MRTEELPITEDFAGHVRLHARTPICGAYSIEMGALDWSWEYLSSIVGDKVVRPMVNMPRSGKFPGSYRNHETSLTFGDFVDLSRSNPSTPCYLAYLRPKELHAELGEDVDFSAISGADDHTDTRVWLGSQGTNSGLHSDLKDNVFVQIHGKKHLWLINPNQTRNVYPEDDNIVNSAIDFPNPDLSTYKKLRSVTVLSRVLVPGDFVYIPKGWWHCLVSLEDSISLNHWYGSPVADEEYIRLIWKQGLGYASRTFLDLLRYGFFRQTQKNNFFFTPPPNGLRLYNYLFRGGFSLANDPVREQ
ncbi:cupin-like domain-containing protein [Paraburkholderia sacchari]|uniref:Cupin-like domain-containing protein n=1 Tax=Paraburkholderia sacchari TaxID=159450 RepID=A0A8T6ZLU1_9BURK|nr:cupin-like domain-containing protein [Paraburkholderia sacchari]NLP65463.1 cupin-like domain-containing protein [Paraburkholderia sacchari]